MLAEGMGERADAAFLRKHNPYPFADIGHTFAATGSPWQWCPAWYSRFTPPALQVLATRAIQAATWAERGHLDAVETLPLEPQFASLVEIAMRVIEQEKRRQEHHGAGT